MDFHPLDSRAVILDKRKTSVTWYESNIDKLWVRNTSKIRLRVWTQLQYDDCSGFGSNETKRTWSSCGSTAGQSQSHSFGTIWRFWRNSATNKALRSEGKCKFLQHRSEETQQTIMRANEQNFATSKTDIEVCSFVESISTTYTHRWQVLWWRNTTAASQYRGRTWDADLEK
jgi:hypothetical protein